MESVEYTHFNTECDDSLEGEQESWRELLRKLEEVQLNLEDFPTREELLWGMLQELGFTSYVERCRLCKQICASKASPIKQTTSGST